MRFTLGKKLAVGFGMITLLMGVSFAVNLWSTSQVGTAEHQAEELEQAAVLMLDKVIDHYKWLNGLNSTFANNKDRVEVQLDPTQCGLGKWLGSEQAANLGHEHPEVAKLLADIVPHHNQLHATATEIDKLCIHNTDVSRSQAEEIFRTKTPLYLESVQEHLNGLRDVLQTMAGE